MVLPLFPLMWGITKVATVVAAAKGTVWSGARFFQHGFDYEATVKQLESDLKASKEFGTAVKALLPTLAGLRVSDDLSQVVTSAHSIERVLESLPTDMRTGLSKSFTLGERIDKALTQAVNRCGVSLIVAATADTSSAIEERLHMFYFGLFLIGRSGNALAKEDQKMALLVLDGLHRSRGNSYDLAAITTVALTTSADTYTKNTSETLNLVPEVYALRNYAEPMMVPLWITKALGGAVRPLPEGTFSDYLTVHFPQESDAI